MGRTASLGSSISRAHRLHERENFLVPASRPGHFPRESYRPCLQRLPILQLLHPKTWSTVIGQPRARCLPWQTSQNHVLTGRKVTSTKKEDGMDQKKRYRYNCKFVSLRDSVDLYLRAWRLCVMRQDRSHQNAALPCAEIPPITVTPLMSLGYWLFRVGRIMSPCPKEVHGLILRACEYVTLHGQKDLADGVKNLEMEMILNYLAKLGEKTL